MLYRITLPYAPILDFPTASKWVSIYIFINGVLTQSGYAIFNLIVPFSEIAQCSYMKNTQKHDVLLNTVYVSC